MKVKMVEKTKVKVKGLTGPLERLEEVKSSKCPIIGFILLCAVLGIGCLIALFAS